MRFNEVKCTIIMYVPRDGRLNWNGVFLATIFLITKNIEVKTWPFIMQVINELIT